MLPVEFSYMVAAASIEWSSGGLITCHPAASCCWTQQLPGSAHDVGVLAACL